MNIKRPKLSLETRSGLLLIVAFVASASIVSASAVSLGVLSTSSLGSTGESATACNTATFAADYTYAYNLGSGRYELATATVSGLDAACNGKTVTVVLGDGTTIAQGDAVVSSGSATVTLSPSTLSAVIVTQTVVMIVG